MIIIVDLDGVICTEEKTFERSFANPVKGARESLQKLHNMGHTIVIYSSRGWAELRMTKEWLKRYGIYYDSLVMGKPIYDLWIDDRALGFTDWLKTIKKIGLLKK
jgi:uncharacterized HAD superfamily protein